MKQEIIEILKKAIKSLEYKLDEVIVDYPKNENFGDYTTNVAMTLARTLKKNPIEIAENVKVKIEKLQDENFEKIEVVAPGYINFYLSKKYLQNKIEEINELREKFGNNEIGKGVKVNNEFISANPTGPLHLGNGRGGFLGDVISNVLKKCEYDVTKEYYVNDAGEQVIKLGHSVLKDSEAVYGGEYIDELNKRALEIKKKLKIEIDDVTETGRKASEIIIKEIIAPTVEKKMKIEGMNYVSERDLYNSKKVNEAIEILKDKNLTYEKEGALWLKTIEFGDDKDRVLVKKDGQFTYFASDCGYILYKIERGFEKIIEIWGADHHGYIKRFEAATKALGFQGKLSFIIVQLVRLMKDGKEFRMSKRAGNVVYVDDLLSEVGLDAARFFFLMYSNDTHMNFDLSLAKERSNKNPVYYVQYAYARICSILKKAEEKKEKADLNLLAHEKELNLIKELDKFPQIVKEISESYEVHKLPYYAISLADKFHSFYNDCKVIDTENLELTASRIELVEAVKIILGESLRLLGVEAPEKM